jgi:hypothetical protein
MAWVVSSISGPYYEGSSQIYVAGVSADSILYRQPLIPYDCQLFGPYSADAVSISADTSLVLTQSAWCWNGQFFGSTLVRAVAGGDSSVLDTLCTYDCDVRPMDLEFVSQGELLAYSAEYDYPNSVLHLNAAGLCETLGSLGVIGEPAHLAYHPNYGYAGIWYNPSWIKISRINLDGTGTEPGVFYWRDDEHPIRSAALAITDDGRIHVVWVEGPNGTNRGTRLLTGWINWDTPLSTSPSEFIPHPSSFSLSCYPNPFNPTTTISFTLAQAGAVELDVYDVLGRHMRSLINQRMTTGSHKLAWSPEGASGIYFVSLHAGLESRVQKIMYVK